MAMPLIWQILLALWLILYGVLALTNITVAAVGIIMGVLAIGAAVLLLLGK